MECAYFKKYKKPDITKNYNCEVIRGTQTNCMSAVDDLKFEPAWKMNKAPRQYRRSKPRGGSCLQIENVVGNATKCFSVNEENSNDKEYVFVFIFNGENAIREKLPDGTKFSSHPPDSDSDGLDLYDISSAIFNENISLRNVTVENADFPTADIKRVIFKVMKKILPEKKIKTKNVADIPADYYLVLNHSTPVTEKKSLGTESITSKDKVNVSTGNEESICHSFESTPLQMSHADLNSLPVESATNKEKGDSSGYQEINIKIHHSFARSSSVKKYVGKVNPNLKPASKESEIKESKGKNELSTVEMNVNAGSEEEGEREVSKKKTALATDEDVKKNLPYKLNADGTVVCTKCNGIYKGLRSLKIHHRKNRCKGGEAPYECERCRSRFKTKKSHIKHKRTVCRLVTEKKKICEYCGREFNDHSTLWQHLVSHRNLRQYKCPECGKGFNKRYAVTLHIKNVHRKEKQFFYCSRCGIRSLNRKHMLAHEETHDLPEGAEIPTPFKCFCGKAYISQYKLTIHQNLAHKPKKCTVCAEVLRSFAELLRHKQYSHGISYYRDKNDKKSTSTSQFCPLCPKKLFSITSLTNHLAVIHKIHNPSRSFSLNCDKCPKALAGIGSFVVHRRKIHHEEVSESELQTITESLKASTSTACAQDEWKCNRCDSKFKSKVYLQNHIYRSHSNTPAERRTCRLCGVEFDSLTKFYLHTSVAHRPSEERTCQICHKVFPDMKRMWNHKIMHVSTFHRCSECGSRLKRKGDYTRHMRDKHGIGKESTTG